MTECKRCARKCDLFICHWCVDNLRKQLHDLPWWLNRLIETAVGQARTSDGGRQSSRRDRILEYTDEKPAVDGQLITEGQRRLEHDLADRQLALRAYLAEGRVNARASDAHRSVHNTLTHWVQSLCEARGIDPPGISQAGDMARWLERHAASVAHQEDADRCCDDIAAIAKTIERIVNRPVPPKFIGPCSADPAPEHVLAQRRSKGDPTTRCNHELTAPRKATEVTCPTCATSHDIETLIAQLFAESGDKLMTVKDLVDWVLPRLGEPVPERTLYRWMKNGALPVRGANEKGDSMVRLSDVLRVRGQSRRAG